MRNPILQILNFKRHFLQKLTGKEPGGSVFGETGAGRESKRGVEGYIFLLPVADIQPV